MWEGSGRTHVGDEEARAREAQNLVRPERVNMHVTPNSSLSVICGVTPTDVPAGCVIAEVGL